MARRFPLPERLAGVLKRLGNLWGRGRRSPGGADASPIPVDPLLQAGRILREAREGRGLGLRQLAQETRISTPVLEAMERGWRDRLPEAAYLRTMLPLLENHLELPGGSLRGALPLERPRIPGPGRDRFLSRFTPGSIDVFTTWQGTLLYGLLILALIYVLNLQQQRLAASGLLSSKPLPPLPDPAAADAEDADELLLRGFPDLRPLRQAEEGQALRLLQTQKRPKGPDLSRGVLKLQLEKPTRVELQPQKGASTSFSAARGEVSLLVQPPFLLKLDPAPARGAVVWNSQVLIPEPDGEAEGDVGRFRYPDTAVKPSSEPVPPAGEAPSPPRP